MLEGLSPNSLNGLKHKRFLWIAWPVLLAGPLAIWKPAASGVGIISLYNLARLHWLWPNEKIWLERANDLSAAGSFERALAHLSQPPLVYGYTAQVQAEFYKVSIYLASGRQHKAQKHLCAINTAALLLTERDKFETLFAYFYLQTGDFSNFLSAISDWSDSDIKEDSQKVILKSLALQEQGCFEKARGYLRQRIDRTQDPDQLWRLYNNLANLEEILGRNAHQRDHLEAAWHYWCVKPVPLGISQVAHNLAIRYVREGNIKRAHEVTSGVFQRIDSENLQQILKWYNLCVEVARESGDRARLSNLHFDFEDRAARLKLTPPERIMLGVTGLRMWLNDGVPLSTNDFVERIEELLGEIDRLAFEDQIPALAEIAHVIQQIWKRFLDFKEGVSVLTPLLNRCDAMFIDREGMIDAHLQTLSPSLVFERRRWLKYRNHSYKIRICQSEDYPDHALKGIFKNLRESAELCEEHQVTVQGMHDWLTICDEFVAYHTQIPAEWKTRLEQEYRNLAEHALDKAEALLEARPHPYGVEEIMLGVADFALQLHEDTTRARYWLRFFKSTNVSAWQYAEWLRERYQAIESKIRL
ncbi:tetratricopeptide repeat protein [Halorhodospira neutriphila]|uniref:tetratricopeptide repeat protein n=1 Tax=Halorhodospira neutriphila TaxID=168379 RepID=UPI00190773C9|nr:hypothetical protein [Halorhodospira neutriphila]